MANFVDLTEQKIDRLSIIKRVENKNGYVRWLCKCDCGNFVTAYTKILRIKNRVHSCGCYTRECGANNIRKANGKGTDNPNYRHGGCESKLYWVWAAMIQRCTNPQNKTYANYGGRGITVCDEWMSFKSFQEWAMANGYKEGLTIDRMDNDGGYSPNNCRWTTMKIQNNNRRKRRWYRKPKEETNDK